MTPEEQAARQAQIDGAKAEVQPLIDTFGGAVIQAVNDAVVKALNEALPLVFKDWLNAKLQAGQAGELNKRGNLLNEKLRVAEAERDQAKATIAEFMAQTREGRLAKLKAQQAKLAEIIAAEEAPPAEERAPVPEPEAKEAPQ